MVAGASVAVAVTSLISLIWSFIVLALFILVTFFEFERRETELEEIGNYIKGEVGSYISNHSFSIGLASITVGIILLSPAFLIKGGGYWHEWQKKVSRALYILQLPFFFIAILLLDIGLILINRKMKDGEKH